MKLHHALAGVALIALTAGGAFALRPHHGGTPPATVTVTTVAVAHCVAHGGLPDLICTPGVLNLNVRQDNIGVTICKSGWTATIRPPTSYTNALKAEGMKAYGLKGRASDYEEDHFVPLELGGDPTDAGNLWPEVWTGNQGAHRKDTVENQLKAAVCAGRMTLAEAQQRIRTDWRAAAR